MKNSYDLVITKPPGPRAKHWIERSKACRSVDPTYSHFPGLFISKAKGSFIEDIDGNKYIDFAHAQSHNIGYSHPEVISTIKKYIEIGGVSDDVRVRLAEKLKEIAPGSLSNGKVVFGNSGSDVAESCIRIVRSYSKRKILLTCQGSYHGGSLGALSITMDRSELRRGCGPFLPEIAYVPYPYCYRCAFGQDYPDCGFLCVEYIKSVYETVAPPEEIAAFFVEPIQVHGGVIVPPAEYFGKVKKICQKNEIILVSDEVITGFGRTGKMFGIENWATEPDMMFMGKPIASGLSLAAIIGSEEIMKFSKLVTSFAGNPVSCAASLKTIEVIFREKLFNNALKVGKHITRRLKEMQQKYDIIGDVRGKGLIIGVELVKNGKEKKPASKETKEVIIRAYHEGLLILPGGRYRQVLRLAPPLNITMEETNKALDILDMVFNYIKN